MTMMQLMSIIMSKHRRIDGLLQESSNTTGGYRSELGT